MLNNAKDALGPLFFHLATPDKRDVDEEGVEFSDADAAFLDAYQAALEMCIDMLRRRSDPGDYRFEICDQNGKLVLELPFEEVMRPSGHLRHSDLPANPGVLAVIKRQMRRSATLKTEISAQFVEAFEHVREARAKLGLPRRA